MQKLHLGDGKICDFFRLRKLGEPRFSGILVEGVTIQDCGGRYAVLEASAESYGDIKATGNQIIDNCREGLSVSSSGGKVEISNNLISNNYDGDSTITSVWATPHTAEGTLIFLPHLTAGSLAAIISLLIDN